VATLALIWWATRRSQSDVTLPLSQGLLVTMLLLAFPVNPYWGQVTLLLPFAPLILALRQVPKPPRWWYLLLAVSLAGPLDLGWYFYKVPGWALRQGVPAGWVTLLFGVPMAALLLFAGLQAYLLWREARQ
jgi:hypothetical protein